MAKKHLICLLMLIASSVAFSQKSITLEDIWKSGTFSSKGVY